MKDQFWGLSSLFILIVVLGASHNPLPASADTTPRITVTQGEAVTLTLKLINTGDVDLKDVTVHWKEATMPDWLVAEDVEVGMDVPVSNQSHVLVPFHFTIDKEAPIGEVEPVTLQIEDAEGSVWHEWVTLDIQPRPKPGAFRLLQNYPNPFNPETWIPYELKEASNVQIRIYDLSGQLVKTLSLGHKEADFYTSRSEAAYWDGRNHIGERVSSGLYFYHLQAESFSDVRKMLILK